MPRSARQSTALYAELLLNIRSLTVFASLNSESTAHTTAELSSDHASFTLYHDHSQVTAPLPISVAPHLPTEIPCPATGRSELTFRLPIPTTSHLVKLQGDIDNVVPWSALELERSSAIRCRSCGTEVVQRKQSIKWNDLPSESWAEMMDFWHCHKPHNHNPSEETSQKGYAAANRPQASCGRGGVGLSYLLLHEQDCRSLKISDLSSLQESTSTILCANCDAVVGILDATKTERRLHKWSLTIDFTNPSIQSKHDIEQWLTAQILSNLEYSASRVFRIPSSRENIVPIQLWVFTPDLWYTSSHVCSEHNIVDCASPISRRAIKVLWKTAHDTRHDSPNSGSTDEELSLDSKLTATLHTALVDNQGILPLSARTFRDWNVSLLHRFSREDVE